MPHKNIPQNRARELGAGRLSFLLTIALAAVFVYSVAVFVPPYLGNQRMREATELIVHRAATQNLSEDNTRAQLHEKALELGLPEGYNIDLKREGKAMTAIVTYTRKVRIPFERNWPVRIEVKDLGF